MGKIYTVPSSAPGCRSCHRVTLGTGDPSVLASIHQPRSWLRHHGWWPPASCLPNSLLSLGPGHGSSITAGGLQRAACPALFSPSPVPATHHLCSNGQESRAPSTAAPGNPRLTPPLSGLRLLPAPPSECNPSLPVTFFPAFPPLQEGPACFSRRFYLLLCFLWPLLPPVYSAPGLRIQPSVT